MLPKIDKTLPNKCIEMQQEITNLLLNNKWCRIYTSRPSNHRDLALIILDEKLGITPWVTSIADKFTSYGFSVFVPDLQNYIKFKMPEKITRTSDCYITDKVFSTPHREEILDSISLMAASLFRHHDTFALIGYSLGATLSFLAATYFSPKAVIGYYGKNIQNYLLESGKIQCPMILHMGKNDPNYTNQAKYQIHSTLIGKYNIAIYEYDTNYGFSNSTNLSNFDADSSQIAEKRTFDTLNRCS